MEGNDREPPARLEILLGGAEHRRKLAELVVDRDADGLKAPLGGVLLLAQRRSGHRRADEICQLQRGFDGLFRAVRTDLLRDGGRVALLAVFIEDAFELLIADGIDQLARGVARALVHAHIERRVLLIGKAARGIVELRRGNAEVKEHPVHAADAQLTQHVVERAEVGVYQRHAIHIVREPPLCRLDGSLVAIEGNEPSSRRQAADDLQRVARAAQRSVEVNAVRPDGERVQAFVQQHRLVAVVDLFHLRSPAPPSRWRGSRG